MPARATAPPTIHSTIICLLASVEGQILRRSRRAVHALLIGAALAAPLAGEEPALWMLDATLPGASARETEDHLAYPLRVALARAPGLVTQGSTCWSGRARLLVLVAPGASIARAVPANALPDRASVGSAAPYAPAPATQVVLEVDRSRLAAHGLTAAGVSARLREGLARGPASRSPEELSGLEIGERAGAPVRLRDVAVARQELTLAGRVAPYPWVVRVSTDAAGLERLEAALRRGLGEGGELAITRVPRRTATVTARLDRERLASLGITAAAARDALLDVLGVERVLAPGILLRLPAALEDASRVHVAAASGRVPVSALASFARSEEPEAVLTDGTGAPVGYLLVGGVPEERLRKAVASLPGAVLTARGALGAADRALLGLPLR